MTPVSLAAWAWRTPLGEGRAALDRLRAGQRAAAPPPPALAPFGVPEVAAIPDEPPPSPHARVLFRLARFGLCCAEEVASSWAGDRDRLGVFTALGGLRALWEDLLVGMARQAEDGSAPWERGLGRVHPYWMLRHLSNNAHALVAIEQRACGEGIVLSGANGGAAAIGAAIRTIRAGRLDAALVVAYDTLLQPELLLEGALRGRFQSAVPGEAVAALLLVPGAGGPVLEVESGIRPGTLAGRAAPLDVVAGMGDCGAATALLQVIALAALGPGSWVADSKGEPGLHARVRVTCREGTAPR